MLDLNVDYVIVGGGTAGCVLAERLSRNPGSDVALVEAGIDTPPNDTPADILDIFPSSQANPAYAWPALKADLNLPLPESAQDHVSVWPFRQGRVMGGGGTLMGMIALRGTPADYDEWRDQGCAGWGWQDVLPYFRRVERDVDFSGPMHGKEGRIPIRRVPETQWSAFLKAAMVALGEQGLHQIADMNDGTDCAFGGTPKTCTTTERVASAQGYLDAETRRRPNLRILARSQVEELLWEGSRVTGVRLAGMESGRILAGETILSAGAIHSPALLMRAGIGPGAELKKLGIDVRVDLRGVGENLQNHPLLSVATHLSPQARQPKSMREMAILWARYSSGLKGTPAADLAMNVMAAAGPTAPAHTVGAVGTSLYKPFSRGHVRLQPGSLAASPSITFNLLRDERDLTRMVIALQKVLTVLNHPAVRSARHEAFLPNPALVARFAGGTARSRFEGEIARMLFEVGSLRGLMLGKSRVDVDRLLQSESELRALLLKIVGVAGHVVGTCRMGNPADPMVVVDPLCRVKHTHSLRIIDGSIIPIIVAANTNLTVQMVAERAADLVLDAHAL
ncbi:GMC family oxidoreductase [Corticibacterium sp. UT-5YL-CI-8]|nr:GMC family oxidoreductase [Tianweitania sp. UT-5YL-CI-8]